MIHWFKYDEGHRLVWQMQQIHRVHLLVAIYLTIFRVERNWEASCDDIYTRRVVRSRYRKCLWRQRPGQLRRRHCHHRQLPTWCSWYVDWQLIIDIGAFKIWEIVQMKPFRKNGRSSLVSSPEHKVPMASYCVCARVSYCDHPVFGVHSYLVNRIEAMFQSTFPKKMSICLSLWNLRLVRIWGQHLGHLVKS